MTVTLPKMLCIGSQKCGTSWLYYNLRQHPDIFFPSVLPGEPDWFSKEVHFFNRDDRFNKGLEFYSRRYENMGSNHGCDITPNYCLINRDRIHCIKEAMPHVRIILMIRNPVDRLWSGTCHHFVEKYGLRGADEATFRSFYEQHHQEFANHIRDTTAISFGKYSEIIDRWTCHFDPQQFMIIFFGAIKSEPKELLQRIFAFLGLHREVDLESFPYRRVTNQKSLIPMPDGLREIASTIYRQETALLRERFGTDVEKQIT